MGILRPAVKFRFLRLAAAANDCPAYGISKDLSRTQPRFEFHSFAHYFYFLLTSFTIKDWTDVINTKTRYALTRKARRRFSAHIAFFFLTSEGSHDEMWNHTWLKPSRLAKRKVKAQYTGLPLLFFTSQIWVFSTLPGYLGLIMKNPVKSVFLQVWIQQQLQ